MLGIAETGGEVVVADLEAGIGTLTRLGDGGVDVVLVVVEPSQKSIEVARRAVALVRERGLGDLIVIVNRVETRDDLELVRGELPGCEIVAVPYDPAVEQADRDGRSVLDAVPQSVAVDALEPVAERLRQRPPAA